MPAFRVVVAGSNVLMEVDGEVRRYGFFVTRIVNALHGEEAKRIALQLVLSSPQLTKGALNRADDRPVCTVETIEMLPVGETPPLKQPGFAFHPEDQQ